MSGKLNQRVDWESGEITRLNEDEEGLIDIDSLGAVGAPKQLQEDSKTILSFLYRRMT